MVVYEIQLARVYLYGAVSPGYSIYMVPCHPATLFIWCSVTRLHHLNGAVSPGYSIYMVPCHPATLFIWCRVTQIHHLYGAVSPG